jgi:hypothetical protein
MIKIILINKQTGMMLPSYLKRKLCSSPTTKFRLSSIVVKTVTVRGLRIHRLQTSSFALSPPPFTWNQSNNCPKRKSPKNARKCYQKAPSQTMAYYITSSGQTSSQENKQQSKSSHPTSFSHLRRPSRVHFRTRQRSDLHYALKQRAAPHLKHEIQISKWD